MNGIAVIFTSILSSGVVAAAISASFSEAKERWLLRRSKIEEIYLSSAKWLKYVNATFLIYVPVCKGVLTYNQMLDLQIKNTDTAIGDQNLRMKMNIEMYEPSLIPPLELTLRELRSLNSVISKITDCCRKNEQAYNFLRPLDTQLEAFGAAGDALLAAVVLRGAEIGAERGQVARSYELASAKIIGQTERCKLFVSKWWNQIKAFMKPKH